MNEKHPLPFKAFAMLALAVSTTACTAETGNDAVSLAYTSAQAVNASASSRSIINNGGFNW